MCVGGWVEWWVVGFWGLIGTKGAWTKLRCVKSAFSHIRVAILLTRVDLLVDLVGVVLRQEVVPVSL